MFKFVMLYLLMPCMKDMMLCKNNDGCWFWGVIVLFTIAHVLIYSFMPYVTDDYWYMYYLYDYCKGLDTSFPMDDLLNCWQIHYLNDNVRLSNIVFTLALLVPKIIPSIITGVLVGVSLWLSSKLCMIDCRNRLLLVALAFVFSFMLPWYEQMFSLCFAFNYIWATVIALLLVYLFFSESKQPNVVLSLFLGLLMGWWHEGFAVPLLGGFVAFFILNRREISISRVAMAVGLFIGLIWLATSPGVWKRYETSAYIDVFIILKKFVQYHIPLLILLVTMFLIAIDKKKRAMLADVRLIVYVLICLIGVLISLCINIGPRTGWCGCLFSIITTIYLWRKLEIKFSKTRVLLGRVFTFLITMFLLSHYVVVVHYAIKVRTETEHILKLYKKSYDGLVFADVTYNYQTSPLAWRKPYFEKFTYRWSLFWMSAYYDNPDKTLRVVPTCLKNADKLNAIKVKGDNPFMIYDGFLFAPVSGDSIVVDRFYEVKIGGIKKNLVCLNFPFTTTSGKEYYFAFPQRGIFQLWFGDIEEINQLQ